MKQDRMYNSFLPTFVLSMLTGIYPMWIRGKPLEFPKRLYLSTIFALVIFSSMLVMVILERFNSMETYYRAKMSNVGIKVVMWTGILCVYVIYICSLKKLHKLYTILQSLFQVDYNLKVDYRKFAIFQIGVYAIGISGIVANAVTQYIYMHRLERNKFSDRTFFCFIFPVGIMYCADMMFVCYVFAMKERFGALNKLLLSLMDTRNENFGKKLEEKWQVNKLTMIMIVYDELCDLSEQLNEVMKVHTLATTTEQFLIVMFGIFNFYWRFTTQMYSAVCWLNWGILKLLESCAKSTSCHLASKESRRTKWIVNRLLLYQWSIKMERKLKIFAAQMVHRNVRFSACGLFEYNASLIYSLVGSSATYTVIVLQFQEASAPIDCVFNITVNSTLQALVTGLVK